jgi:hypothetical protein
MSCKNDGRDVCKLKDESMTAKTKPRAPLGDVLTTLARCRTKLRPRHAQAIPYEGCFEPGKLNERSRRMLKPSGTRGRQNTAPASKNCQCPFLVLSYQKRDVPPVGFRVWCCHTRREMSRLLGSARPIASHGVLGGSNDLRVQAHHEVDYC